MTNYGLRFTIWDLFVIVYTGYRRLEFVIVYTGYRRLEFGIWDFNNLQNIGTYRRTARPIADRASGQKNEKKRVN
ncbi:MAG: hypothetical protein PHY20_14240 [Bacteroidales bacterium]|nr:hypothetical protein [Bacteroidales bacterium]